MLNSSVERPAWTQYDWGAYNHRHSPGKIKKDYYRKSKNKRRQKINEK